MALIQYALRQLTKVLEAAASNEALETAVDRFTAVANANRQWALHQPIDFQLIYGNPMPGYVQPTDRTFPPARRSFIVTARLFAATIESGEIDPPSGYCDFPPAIEQSLRALTKVEGHELPFPALYLAAAAWAKIHGHIMLDYSI